MRIAGLFACLSLATTSAGEGKPPLRVLFVGNSYLYTNDLPARVRQLAEGSPVVLETELRAKPDYGLADHLGERAFLEALEQPWDWVVLQQGPSSLPASREELLASVRVIHARLHGKPIRIALFAAWPSAGRASTSQEGEASYRLAAEAVGACVLPVATAWRLAREDRTMPELYQRDRLHPTRNGTTLAARVVVQGLLGSGAATVADASASAAVNRIVGAAYAQEPLACKPG